MSTDARSRPPRPHARRRDGRLRNATGDARRPGTLLPAVFVVVAALLAPAAATAQRAPEARANWALADRFSTDALRNAVGSAAVVPRWIAETDSMWYHWREPAGSRFMFVVPRTRTHRPLFDHAKLAAALSAMGGKPQEATNLPFTTLTFSDDLRSIRFIVDSTRYEWNLAAERLASLGRVPRDSLRALQQQGQGGFGGGFGPGGQQQADFRNFSPDSTAFAFARDHDLFVVEVATGDTIRVSTDGEQHFSFGFRDTTQVQQQQDDDDEDGQRGQQARGRDPRVRANVTWSPDSRAFAVTRNDQREVAELYLVDVLAEPRPTLRSYRYAMPGEDNVAQQELYVYHRGDAGIRPVDVRRWRDQRLFDIHWTTGSDRLRLVRRDRLQRNLELIEVQLATGAITPLLSESVENAFLERQNARYVRAGGDFVWWSERTGWGHYYLYDHQGRLKGPITAGEWRAETVAAIDSVRGRMWFSAVGREPGENVYYRHLYRVNLDGSGLMLLDPGHADHASVVSPSRRYIVDNHSRIDLPGRSLLRDENGAVLMELEAQDVSRLEELGWQPPERFTVKAGDGVTDIYGNLWKPFDFDSTKRYPIIAHVYPGPQTEQVTLTFAPTAIQQRLAQLGFIVIQIGNRGGSPRRSNAYHSYGYFNLRDYGLEDKKVGIEQLAARHPWIDIDRVGIYGHSGGGFMTAAALLLPPYNDFFKVGVSSAGNHDNNVYNQNWSEQHHGLREVRGERAVAQDGNGGPDDDVRFEIRVPANHELAENLKGRLLLVHGDMDNNVHPAGTIRLANALIQANKRFDLFIMPGRAHGYAQYQPYYNRLMFEYFAEHLLGDYYRDGADIR